MTVPLVRRWLPQEKKHREEATSSWWIGMGPREDFYAKSDVHQPRRRPDTECHWKRSLWWVTIVTASGAEQYPQSCSQAMVILLPADCIPR